MSERVNLGPDKSIIFYVMNVNIMRGLEEQSLVRRHLVEHNWIIGCG